MSEGPLLGCHDTYNNDPVERLYAKCHYTDCRFALCFNAKCHYTECHFALCFDAECLYAEYYTLLSVIMLRIMSVNDIMLSIRILSFIRKCC
jgi:hypothetical protein